ncbi:MULTISPECIES: RES family NAD+ phosphorylase [Clavibacter]|uniref:RES domain-containing protein n=2 Tax=Clavibacter TaxID=1573 RepID=A0A399NW99_9MICO|nr:MULTISPECIES: RES family NAD+ phosphorylase [Clavibacter]RII98057.1 RES domain-containing protein [Clavibacter michiganensis]UKF25469.1 RES family NAD+ phosphorylase [Clavibacter sp. A6099]
MPERRCCPTCFGDAGLRDNIFPDLDRNVGTCSFCGEISSQLVEPEQLREYFETLVEIYDVSEDGQFLPTLLRQDWGLFSHTRMDDPRVKELLAEILNDGDIVRRTFIPSPAYQTQSLTLWDDLRDEMMHNNRWFLDHKIDFDRLGELLDLLITDPRSLGRDWFRARLNTEDTPFPPDKMGAPPRRLAAHGRANPAGIPYLYIGSTPETAVAEIRPHTGEHASVALFSIDAERVVDLRNPRERVSPFILEEANQIGQLLADLPLLERLGSELTRPVLPQSAPYEYIPSQYLCEFIKVSGFDGVLYRSSVSAGVNLALFKPESAQILAVNSYNVNRVSVSIAVD